MSRRGIILAVILGAVVLAACGWWISTHFERVAVTRDTPPEPEAQHNPYLALERFMTRMGRSIVSTGDVRTLDKLPPHGVLILDRHHRAILGQERLKALFDWVGKGGYLIVVPEDGDEPDPVMAYLHVHWDDDAQGSCDDCRDDTDVPGEGAAPASAPAATPGPSAAAGASAASGPAASPARAGAGALLPASMPASAPVLASAPGAPANSAAASAPRAASAPAAAPATDTGGDDSGDAGGDDASGNDEADDGDDDGADAPAPPRPKTFPALIPGATRAQTIAMQYSGLAPGDIQPVWEVLMDDNSAWLLDYRYGLGNVSLVASLDDVLSNDSIADYDHAEFFWKLLQHFQPTGPVTLMTHLPVPDLFDWLVDSAWAASLSGLVLLVLWLWQIAPRFGGTAPDLPPSRRELREHLNAVGRFVWRSEGLGRWLEVARTAFRERLAMRHPAIAAMSAHEQADALARLTALPREEILHALTAGAGNASEFTAMLRTLKHLKHNL